jgi:hypothetical protein
MSKGLRGRKGVNGMTMYVARHKYADGKVAHTKPFTADEDFLRELKAVAFRANVDMTVEVYNPQPHSLARRSIVSHKSAAFVREG